MEEEIDLSEGYIAALSQEITESDVKNWRSQHQYLCAPLPKDIRGYVRDPKDETDGFILFQPLVQDEDGWHPMEVNVEFDNSIAVPKNRLRPIKNIGSGVTIEGLLPTAHLESVKVSEKDSPLEQLIACFFDTILANGPMLINTGMTQTQLDFLAQEKNRILSTMIRGFKTANTFELFKDGLPSLEDLTSKVKCHRELSRKVKSELKKEYVIYVNVYYYKIRDTINGSTYWGQTKQGTARATIHGNYLGHGAAKATCCKNHYEGANKILCENKDSAWVWLPIIRMKEDTFSTFRSMDLAWAEQTTIALFSRYNEKLTKMPSHVGVAEQLWSAGLARRMEKLVDDMISQNPRFQSFDIHLVEGWLGGLNWGSPILESLRHDSPLWIGEVVCGKNGKPLMYAFTGQPRAVFVEKRSKLDLENETEEYERAVSDMMEDLTTGNALEALAKPTKLPKKSKSKAETIDLVGVYLFNRTIRKHGSQEKRQHKFSTVLHSILTKSEDWGLEAGDIVTPILEFMYDEDEIHPESWAALTRVGGFDKWKHANRFAIRYEWRDKKTKEWKTRYVYPAYNFSFHDGLDDSHGTAQERYCMERHFITAIAMCATFLSWEWKAWESPADGLRSDLIEPFSVRVKMANFDVDTHTLTISDPEPVLMDRPRLLSYSETMWELKRQYGKYCLVGIPKEGVFHDANGTFWARQNTWKMCDTCWLPKTDADWHRNHSEEHELHFRWCEEMHVLDGLGGGCACGWFECTEEEWEPGEHPYTCNMCSRLRRWCTYNHGYWLWKDYDFWKTLTMYKREGKFGEKARILSGPTGLNYIIFGRAHGSADLVPFFDEEEAGILQGDGMESIH